MKGSCQDDSIEQLQQALLPTLHSAISTWPKTANLRQIAVIIQAGLRNWLSAFRKMIGIMCRVSEKNPTASG